MKKAAERVVVGVVLIVAGIFLVLNQFTFKIAFFPWILLAIGVALFLISLISGNFFGGLQSLIWLGGLAFAFYYDQLLAGILIIIGCSIIISAFQNMFRKTTKVNIEINNDNEE